MLGTGRLFPAMFPHIGEQRDGRAAVEQRQELQALEADLDQRLEGLDRVLLRDVHHLAGLPNHIDEQHRAIRAREGDDLPGVAAPGVVALDGVGLPA